MFENLWDGLWFINCLGSIAFCSYEQFKRWWTHSVRSFLHPSIIFKLSNNFRHHSLFIFRQCAACLYIPQCLCVSQSGLDKLVEVALTTLRPWWRHVLQYNYKVDSSSTTGLSKVCALMIGVLAPCWCPMFYSRVRGRVRTVATPCFCTYASWQFICIAKNVGWVKCTHKVTNDFSGTR